MSHQRIKYIDIAKGIATLLVIIGHLSYTPPGIKAWLYTFHIPLFFFLSGFVLNCNFPKLLDFLKLKIKRILLPYLWLSIITWIFVECIYQSVLNLDYHSFQKILGIFICAKSTPYYLTLWFIISLFFAQIIIYLLSRLKNKKKILMFLVMLFLLGIYISSIYEPGWILVSDTIPMASFFVGLGFFSRQYYDIIKNFFNIPCLIICTCINYMAGMVNLNYVSRVDLFYQDLGNPILFLSSAISGIYMIIIFSKFIQNFKPIQYVGKNSLLFYAFHSPIFIPIADKIVEILIIQNIPLICYDTIKMFIALFTVCIGMVIVCEIVNRYFSFVLGKKKLV